MQARQLSRFLPKNKIKNYLNVLFFHPSVSTPSFIIHFCCSFFLIFIFLQVWVFQKGDTTSLVFQKKKLLSMFPLFDGVLCGLFSVSSSGTDFNDDNNGRHPLRIYGCIHSTQPKKLRFQKRIYLFTLLGGKRLMWAFLFLFKA